MFVFILYHKIISWKQEITKIKHKITIKQQIGERNMACENKKE